MQVLPLAGMEQAPAPAQVGTDREATLPKKTWCTKLNMSQPYGLVAKKNMRVAKYWNELPMEHVKFQFLQIMKT